MSGSLRLNGSTSGFSEITAPDVAGDQTFTLPAVGGNLVVYQEGVWTPVLSVGSYVTASAYWTRIGNRVEVDVSVTNFTDSTTSSAIELSGLPYDRTTESFSTQGATRVRYIDFDNYVSCGITSASAIRFYSSNSGDAAATLNHSDIVTANKNSAQFIFNLSYLTNDTTFVPINGATIS